MASRQSPDNGGAAELSDNRESSGFLAPDLPSGVWSQAVAVGDTAVLLGLRELYHASAPVSAMCAALPALPTLPAAQSRPAVEAKDPFPTARRRGGGGERGRRAPSLISVGFD